MRTAGTTVTTGADPQTIGDAAGNAVRSWLRSLLADGRSMTE